MKLLSWKHLCDFPDLGTQGNRPSRELLLPHQSSAGAERWLGGAGGGSLWLPVHYLQSWTPAAPARQQNRRGQSARSSAVGGEMGFRGSSEPVFHFHVCAFEHGLKSLENNFHPAAVMCCPRSCAGKRCVGKSRSVLWQVRLSENPPDCTQQETQQTSTNNHNKHGRSQRGWELLLASRSG